MANQTVGYFISLINQSKQINKKEKEILIRRLKRTILKKIGKKNKVTAEWIRQIEKKALNKLKKPSYQPFLFEE